ncbi:MAG: ribonuclease HI family protein [Patescibacteria group bacterium]
MSKQKIYLNTDGGSRGNPGNAGCGVVICDDRGTILKKIAKPLGKMTNNEAEYWAVITGLENVKKILGKKNLHDYELEVRMDSELVKSQLSGEYQIKEAKLWPLFIKIWNMQVKDLPPVKFTYIPREKNKLADLLANQAMDEGSKQSGLFRT